MRLSYHARKLRGLFWQCWPNGHLPELFQVWIAEDVMSFEIGHLLLDEDEMIAMAELVEAGYLGPNQVSGGFQLMGPNPLIGKGGRS